MKTIQTILLTLAIIVFLIPVILYYWINGNLERYLWIISGPPPYCYFGSGPYQLRMYLIFIGIGLFFLVFSFILRHKKTSKHSNDD